MLFATLHITSDSVHVLPEVLSSASAQWEFTDDHEYRKERRERLHKRLGTIPPPVPRYHWKLCSDGMVVAPDPLPHIKWLLSLFEPNVKLYQLNELGFDYWLAFCWSGNGSGGGPSINEELSNLLNSHKTRLDIGFYYEDAS